MDRKDTLARLHNIPFGAKATVITMDMGLQYQYVCPEGAGDGFGNMGDWPCHYIRAINKDKLAAIRSKIKQGILVPSDFDGTNLKSFHEYVFSVDRFEEQNPNEKFNDLCSLPEDYDGDIYCLCDARDWYPTLKFFTNQKALEEAFQKEYCDDINKWDSMSDDELQEWLERISDGLQGIYLINYEDYNRESGEEK